MATDLTGQRFSRLVVIAREGTNKFRASTWLCQCDCGNRTVVARSALQSGGTKSCGCWHRDYVANQMTTHGKKKHRLWSVWSSMRQRCSLPSHKDYRRYGGRGITVCDEWMHDFQSFYDWAMANGYDENAPYGQCTIDRIDNDKGYSPDNCRWVDMKVQSNNRAMKGLIRRRV